MKRIFLLLLVLLTNNWIIANDTICGHRNYNETILRLENDVKEIRRDQLNYKIEKDLLKDTYSSNYSTVQLIISLILGVFTVLGYIGLKGIISIKKEYDSELVLIKELKGEFENKLKELTTSQEKVSGQIETIDSLNKEQNIKIQTLEIKEKVGSWYNQKNYQRALDYIAIGLELTKDDPELLMIRAFSLLKLKNYPEAIEAHRKVISIDPSNASVIQNLAELYLLVGQYDSYYELVKSKGEYLKSDSNSLITYFESVILLKQNKLVEFRKLISDFINKGDLSINKNYLGGWGFSEVYDNIKDLPNTPEKNIFTKFTNYLNGTLSGLQIKEILDK